MHSTAYEAMKNEMEKGTYTSIEAVNTINSMYAKKALSDTEYEELMDLAGSLSANSAEGEHKIALTALDERIKKVEEYVESIKTTIAEGGTEVPEPEPEADGSEFNPITAYAGMLYMPGLYYKDPEDGQIYKAGDTLPAEGERIDVIPHNAVNIYFDYVRKE